VGNAARLTRGLSDGRKQRRMEKPVDWKPLKEPEKMRTREGAPDELDTEKTKRKISGHDDEISTVRSSDRGRPRRRLVAPR